MNKQDFISLVETPQSLGKQHIPSLRSVTADFPYFQTAQVLLTKALYNEKHYEFEKQLKHVSLMSPDRAVLFRFIHSINTPAPDIELSSKEEIELVLAEQPKEETIIPEPAIIIPPAIETFQEPLDTEQTTETLPVEEFIQDVQPIVIEQTITPIEEEKPETNITSSQTHSFAEWLLLQQQQKIEPDTINTVDEQQIQAVENQEADNTTAPEPQESPSMQDEIAQQVLRSNVNEFESILDRFIRENPRISRAKAEFYNPVNMAKQSVEENDEIVTETLANVYYKQGHFKKAIRTYEKLCLIYPHKMSYFASLIQKIKTENKD